MLPVSSQTAHLKSLAEAMALHADLHQFDELEQLFAAEVVIDYSSLWGGTAETMPIKTLLSHWAQVLTGFTCTRHELQNLQVTITGQVAKAQAQVQATHWLGDEQWIVAGDYQYEFITQDNIHWRLSKLTFLLAEEHGNRELVTKALVRAKENTPAYLRKQFNRKAVQEFLHLLTKKDILAFLALWDENGIQDMPYSPGDFPKKISGKAALTQHWSGVNEFIGKMDFYDIHLLDSTNPDVVIMQYRSEIEILTTQQLYKNDYITVIEFTPAGKIARFLEYYDPIRLQQAWGLTAEK